MGEEINNEKDKLQSEVEQEKKDNNRPKGKKLRIFIIIVGILLIGSAVGYMFSGDEHNKIILGSAGLLGVTSEYAQVQQSSDINIQTGLAQWYGKRASGIEAGLTFWKSGTDKKVELGWIPKSGSCTGWGDEILYGRNGQAILDDKGKAITLKCETAKCSGSNCYHISLTTAQAINIDDYVRLGNNSYESASAPTQSIQIDKDGAGIICSIEKNVSGTWNPIEALWSTGNEWGLNDTYSNGANERYRITCNSNLSFIHDNDSSIYVYGEAYHDFTKSCQSNAGCLFEDINSTSMRVSLISNGFIDPEYIIPVVSSNGAGVNATLEPNNCTHLSINPSLTLMSNVLSYYNFDCDGGVTSYDLSPNSIDTYLPSASGAMTSDIAGKYGKGLYLDGTDDELETAQATTSPLYNSATEGTVSFWFYQKKTNALQSMYSYNRVSAGNNIRFSIELNASNNLAIWARNSSTVDVLIAGFNQVTNYTWHHVLYTSNASGNWLYYDGVAQTGTYGVGGATSNIFFAQIVALTNGRNIIGASYSNAYQQRFGGYIDDLLILNTSVTAEQVTDIYNDNLAKFYPRGELYHPNVNIVAGNNTVDVSLSDFEANSSTYDALKIGFWDTSLDYNDSDPSIIGHWTGDAIINNTNVITGKVGNGLIFDETNDYILLSSNVNVAGDVTLSYWFNTNSLPAGTNKVQIDFATSAKSGENIVCGTYSGTYLCSWNGTVADSRKSNATIATGNWYHVIVTKNTTAITGIYINNSLTTASSTTSFGTNNQAQVIGALNNGGYGSYYAGLIDEVRVWNRTLTITEIANIYGNESSGSVDPNMNRTGLILELNMNETGQSNWASVTPDTSGNNNHGAMVSMNGATLIDNSIYGNNGTLFGYANIVSAGKFNQSFSLLISPSQGWMQAPDSSSLNFSRNDFSASMWMNRVSGTNNIIMGKMNGASTLGWRFRHGATSLIIDVGNGSVYRTGTATYTIPAGTWTHLVFTVNRSSTNYQIYANGVPLTTAMTGGIGATDSVYNPEPFYLARYTYAGLPLNAGLDDVILFNRTLSTDEVKTLYQKGLANWNFTAEQTLTENTASNYANYINSTQIISCWLDGVTDSCGGGNDAVASGDANWINSNRGTIGNLTAGLDGTGDYFTLASGTNTNMTSGMTISYWVKSGLQSASKYIITKGTGCYATTQYGYDSYAGTGADIIVRYCNGSVARSVTLSGINDYTWHHITQQYDGANVYTYLDGSLANAQTMTGTIATSSLSLSVSSASLNGYVDEIAIWNRTLSATEVQQIYTESKQCRSAPMNFSISTTADTILPVGILYSNSNNSYTPFIRGLANVGGYLNRVWTEVSNWLSTGIYDCRTNGTIYGINVIQANSLWFNGTGYTILNGTIKNVTSWGHQTGCVVANVGGGWIGK